ncbi:MAG: hypothetical protein K1Y36_17395 [Blastocatellia bacterium]|nr:hypothetical protein [Blastocatellia bacterium]
MVEHTLLASGRLRFVLVLNLSRFLDFSPASETKNQSPTQTREQFNHLRGSPAFLAALRNWKPGIPFVRDLGQDRIEEEGYRLRVFRSRLRETQFLPTYRLEWSTGLLEQLREACPDLPELAHAWTVRIRFTPYGLAVVLLERELKNRSLVEWTEEVLEMQRERCLVEDMAPSEQQVQWLIARWALVRFLETVGWELKVSGGHQPCCLRFQKSFKTERPLRLDRYVLHLFDTLQGPQGEVSPYDLKTAYKQVLAGLMEGSILIENHQKRFPTYPPVPPCLEDVSSWEEELCVVTGEAGLVYTPLAHRGIVFFSGMHGRPTESYLDYWEAVVRGFEHVVAFRAETERAQRRTVELLGKIPHLTQRVNDGHIGRSDEAEIASLAGGLSDIFDTLPEQRSMEISAIFFRADAARRKFEILMERLDVPQILGQLNTNVEQLSYFLEYYNDMRLQWQSQRINTLAWRVGVVVLFMASTSFLNDGFQVYDRWNQAIGPVSVRHWTLLTFGFLVFLLVLVWIQNVRIWRKK